MVRRIGLWNTAFLGDAVLTLPLIQTLHATFPEATLDFWVRRGVGTLFTAHPDIAAVHEFDKKGGLSGALQTAKHIRNAHYDLWINAHTSPRSALMSLAAHGGARTIGYDAPLYNKLVHTHTVPRRFHELDEIERLLQLTIPLNNLYQIQEVSWPNLVLPESAHAAAATYWRDNVRGPVLGMHPGSVWATKRWTVDGFADIAKRAVSQGAHVMVFAGPSEVDVANEVIRRAHLKSAVFPDGTPALLNVAGKLSLCELGAYLNRLNCYLSNDSGPMHMAWAQRTPITAVFGPTVRQLGFYPRGPQTTVLEADLDCRPCGLHGPQVCPQKHHNCMRHVTANMVWDDIVGKLFG